MRHITWILDAVERTQRLLTLAFFSVTIVIVAFQVFNRFWLQRPVLWTADAAVICFVWMALLSASNAVRTGGHFRMTALIDSRRIAGASRRWLELLALLAVIALSVVLMVQGSQFAYAGAREQAPGLGVAMVWAYVSVPLCSFTAILFALEKMHLVVKTARATEQSPLPAEVA